MTDSDAPSRWSDLSRPGPSPLPVRQASARRFRVRAAFVAAALRLAAGRFRAALRACRDNAVRDAALCPSRFSAVRAARDRRGDALFPARRDADAALRFVVDLAPAGGLPSLTPARRAFDRPMAIACFVDRAPCLPSLTCSISSRTNSPACVDAAFPWRLSRRARSSVAFSGMVIPSVRFEGNAGATWQGFARAEGRQLRSIVWARASSIVRRRSSSPRAASSSAAVVARGT